MGLEKAIEHNKEKRKQYRDSRRVDTWCRNHGMCRWCEGNRLYSRKKRDLSIEQRIDEWFSKKGRQ